MIARVLDWCDAHPMLVSAGIACAWIYAKFG